MSSNAAISVRIGDVVSPSGPSTYWVMPLASVGDERHSAIYMLEKDLATSMLSSPTPVGPTTPLSTALPVLQGAFWHRGLLQSLSQYGRRLRARVFLTDYGTTLQEVEVEGRVLLLPPALSLLPPLAFLVVLAGLQPASMDLDLCQVREGRGMRVAPARRWDSAATNQVRELVAHCRVGEVRDWVRDRRGRHHGQLVLLFTEGQKEFSVNDFLVSGQFALYSQEGLEQELAAEPEQEGAKELEEEEEYSGEESSEDEVEEVLEIGRRLQDLSVQSCLLEKSGEAPGMRDISRRQCLPGPEVRSLCSVPGQLVGRGRGRGQALTCREKLLQLKERNRAREEEKRKVEQQEGDMWDTFRGAARGSVDDSSRASSNLLPGGVMVGKFHESVLANLNSEGGLREQKELFEKFVLKS